MAGQEYACVCAELSGATVLVSIILSFLYFDKFEDRIFYYYWFVVVVVVVFWGLKNAFPAFV